MPKAACQKIEEGSGEEPEGLRMPTAHHCAAVDLLYSLATKVRIGSEPTAFPLSKRRAKNSNHVFINPGMPPEPFAE